MASLQKDIRATLRAIPDYPKPGILFQDITPVLRDSGLLRRVVAGLAEPFQGRGITHVAGIEARGFILGAPVAVQLGAGFIPVRKAGKLPGKTLSREYALEYGTATLEAHEDHLGPENQVLIIDDVLATGGTAQATAHMIRQSGARLAGWAFLLEIAGLGGREKLSGAPIQVLAGTADE